MDANVQYINRGCFPSSIGKARRFEVYCPRTDLFSSFLSNKSNGSQTRPHFVEIGLKNH